MSLSKGFCLRTMALAATLSVAGFVGSAMAGKIVYWSMWNETEPQAVALKKIMNAYTAANPKTTFSVVWNGRQNQTKLRGALQAGTPVDLMDQDGDQLFGGLQKQGILRDLSKDLDEGLKNALLPKVLDLYAQDGKIAQFPYIYNTLNFWYDRAALKEIGGAVPATFDDLLTLCARAKDHKRHALVVESNVPSYNIAYFAYYMDRKKGPLALVKAFEDKSGEGWSDPAVLEAAQSGRRLWDAGCFPPDARGFQYPVGQQTIALGETIGALVGSWLPAELSTSAGPDFQWGAFNYPAVSGGTGAATDLQASTIAMAVLNKAPNAAEAIDFLKFLVSEDSQKTFVNVAGVGVVRKGVPWPAQLTDAYDAASKATSVTPFGGGLSVHYPEFSLQVLTPEYNKMFLGGTTPENFVATLKAETKKYWASRK